MESKPSKISNGSADDQRSTESISPQSRRRKKMSNHKKECDDDDDVEKWAKAIIKYHQQTEDFRIRYQLLEFIVNILFGGLKEFIIIIITLLIAVCYLSIQNVIIYIHLNNILSLV